MQEWLRTLADSLGLKPKLLISQGLIESGMGLTLPVPRHHLTNLLWRAGETAQWLRLVVLPRRLRFESQSPHDGLQPFITLVP